jgi:predicted nucleic acid-binding protein
MGDVFADTYYFIALLTRQDEDHLKAVEATRQLNGRLVTSAWVLTELGNFLSPARNKAAFLTALDALQNDPDALIVPPDAALHQDGIDLYAERMDKDWSLTDCISFIVMRREGISDALTGDHHFEQAGFRALLKK